MLMSLKDFLKGRSDEGHSWPSIKMLYFWSFCDFKGFSAKCIRRCGRKLLIDKGAFESWLNSMDEKNGGENV